MRLGHGKGNFTLVEESNKYKLEMSNFNHDEGYEGSEILETTNIYLEVDSVDVIKTMPW